MTLLFSALILLLSSVLSALADSFRDDLNHAGINAIFPGQPDYANASRPFNLRFDVFPAAVTFPTSAQQVSEIVKLGNAFGLKIAARSGGHSYIANSLGNGTICIDLSNMKNITFDARTGRALVETGNRLGDVASALNDVGRGLPHGTCPYVGIGGHAGHGGFGFPSRMWGLTVDNIVSINVVLANGTITTASESVNSDLFWAMRGSASSFAIATAYEFRTFPTPDYSIIFQYNWHFNYTMAAQALLLFQEFAKTNIPPEFGAEIILTPSNIQDFIFFGLTGSWYGVKGGENTTIEPFLRAMPPLNSSDFMGNGTWLDNLLIFAGGSLDTKSVPDITDTFYAKSLMIPESAPLTIEASTAFMKYLSNEALNTTPKFGWFLEAELFGGSNSAINAVPLDATSFAHRDSLLTIQFYASAPGLIPPYPASGFTLLDGMVNSITSNMPKDWAYGAYLNYIDNRLPDFQKRYYASHYPRLQALKRELDPHDVFKFPDLVQP